MKTWSATEARSEGLETPAWHVQFLTWAGGGLWGEGEAWEDGHGRDTAALGTGWSWPPQGNEEECGLLLSGSPEYLSQDGERRKGIGQDTWPWNRDGIHCPAAGSGPGETKVGSLWLNLVVNRSTRGRNQVSQTCMEDHVWPDERLRYNVQLAWNMCGGQDDAMLTAPKKEVLWSLGQRGGACTPPSPPPPPTPAYLCNRPLLCWPYSEEHAFLGPGERNAEKQGRLPPVMSILSFVSLFFKLPKVFLPCTVIGWDKTNTKS